MNPERVTDGNCGNDVPIVIFVCDQEDQGLKETIFTQSTVDVFGHLVFSPWSFLIKKRTLFSFAVPYLAVTQ